MLGKGNKYCGNEGKKERGMKGWRKKGLGRIE